MRMTTVSRLISAVFTTFSFPRSAWERTPRCSASFLLLVTCLADCALAATPEPTQRTGQILRGKSPADPGRELLQVPRLRKQKGSLRLDVREAVLAGGESGPVIVPGKPDESPLVEAIKWESLEMPPTGKLNEARSRR